MIEENANYFIPNKINENDIIDVTDFDDKKVDKLFYDKLDEFNSISANREICYVLKIKSLVSEDLLFRINNSYQFEKDGIVYFIIHDRYLTKKELSDIKKKYFHNIEDNFDIVYYGGITYHNMVKGTINDKRNRLDSKFKN